VSFVTGRRTQDVNGILRPYALSLFHPVPRDVLMIGLSSGSWAQVIANNPAVASLTVVEINPGYMRLVQDAPAVASVLRNPKVTVKTDDGRRWLRLNPGRQFDAIVSNTTFYFRANIGNLLSVEFLDLIKDHLKHDGVFFYKTTGSARIQRIACLSFPHGAQFTNHMVVSPSPIAWDFGRWRRTLENYRIKAALSKQNAPISDDQILEFEQLQVHQSDRIRDAERLFAQRLLDLDAGNLGGGFIHVRIDERTDARGQRIAQIGDIGPLSRKIGRCRTERARGGGDRTDGGLGVRQHVGEAARRHLAFYLVKILCGRREGRKRRHRGCGGR
jgi:SAM-dependent methyltransferase